MSKKTKPTAVALTAQEAQPNPAAAHRKKMVSRLLRKGTRIMQPTEFCREFKGSAITLVKHTNVYRDDYRFEYLYQNEKVKVEFLRSIERSIGGHKEVGCALKIGEYTFECLMPSAFHTMRMGKNFKKGKNTKEVLIATLIPMRPDPDGDAVYTIYKSYGKCLPINSCKMFMQDGSADDLDAKGDYYGSNHGKLFSLKRNKCRGFCPIPDQTFYPAVLLPVKHENGYECVELLMGDKSIKPYAHRVFAALYVPNPDPEHFIEVNHKNTVRDDKSPENLEWCKPSYNKQYSPAFSALKKAVKHIPTATLIAYSQSIANEVAEIRENDPSKEAMTLRVSRRKELVEQAAQEIEKGRAAKANECRRVS
jgi:hypothetical protein